MENAATDLELIGKVKTGCQSSFEVLISRYSDKAFSLANRLTRNQEDAEEVLQDVFVTVFRKIDGFEGKSSFSSWLYRVTVNSALMKIRKRKQEKNISIEEEHPQVQMALLTRSHDQPGVDQATLRGELGLALESAVQKLPDEYRFVFILRDIDGLTSREVGRILKLSVPAVKSRLHRSRLMLRRKLSQLYREYITGDERSTLKFANE